jgi:hypothetical protein
VRNWFPSEFTWRLYVVLQVAALIGFALIVLALLANGQLIKYRSIYEEIEVVLAEVEAECARRPLTAADKWFSPEADPAKRLQACIDYETQPRFVGKEIVGIKSKDATLVLILLMLAFAMPFGVVRVPTWLWEGWRNDRGS